MFTGIIQEVGLVRELRRTPAGARIVVEAPRTVPRLTVGESVAVNGVCLTVVHLEGDTFSADAVPHTLRTTSLGDLAAGEPVNLEPPLRTGDPMGGHWVMGHVDGTGKVVRMEADGDSTRVEIQCPGSLSRYIVDKGSIAVEGVSLTVAETAGDRFTVVLVPHTLQATTFSRLSVGRRVNLEVDVLGKYVEKLLAPYVPNLAAEARKPSRPGSNAETPGSTGADGAERKTPSHD